MKRRTALKGTFLSLLAASTPALARQEWLASMTDASITSTDAAIQLYGFLNGVTSADRASLVGVFPELLPLLNAPRLDVGYGEASGESRATQAAEAALTDPLLSSLDPASIQGIHIAIKSRLSGTRLGEISAAVKTIRRHLPDGAEITFCTVNDVTMGSRLQVSILAASRIAS